jgi:trehalose synthase
MNEINTTDITVGHTEGGLAELLRGENRYGHHCGVRRRWLRLPMPSERAFDAARALNMLCYGVTPDVSISQDEIRKALNADIAAMPLKDELLGSNIDVVILHDPQALGLAPVLAKLNLRLVWRLHLGTTTQNAYTRQFWSLMGSYLRDCAVVIVHDKRYVPAHLGASVCEVRPGIDPLTVKNATQIVPSEARSELARSPDRVEIHSDGADSLDSADVMLVQLARWAPLKDPVAALRVAVPVLHSLPTAHILLAGASSTTAQAHDTLGATILERATHPDAIRRRMHVWSLPSDQNNNDQRLTGLVQCAGDVHLATSRAEGYGLAVAEAMWKGRPVVGRDVGGIERQIRCCAAGYVASSDDLLSRLARRLAADPAMRSEIGSRARRCVASHGLIDRNVAEVATVLRRALQRR